MGTQWLNLKQVAEYLNVDYHTVLAWRDDPLDPLPCWLPKGNHKQPRVHQDELDEWVRRNWTCMY